MSGTGAAGVHASAFIGPGVELGERVVVGPFAVLLGRLTVGDGAWIGPGAHIGGPPEIATLRHNAAWTGDLDYHEIRIGARTRIRDRVVIHHGSERPTIVGEDCLLFAGAYVAHDVHIGAGVTLSAGTSVGGHATIRSMANLGLNVSVHQRRVIGATAMVGMGTTVTRDIPPFTTVFGVPPRVHGLNSFGLRRAGHSEQTIATIRAAYASGDPHRADGAPADVVEELAWWSGLPELRPIVWEPKAFATEDS